MKKIIAVGGEKVGMFLQVTAAQNQYIQQESGINRSQFIRNTIFSTTSAMFNALCDLNILDSTRADSRFNSPANHKYTSVKSMEECNAIPKAIHAIVWGR